MIFLTATVSPGLAHAGSRPVPSSPPSAGRADESARVCELLLDPKAPGDDSAHLTPERYEAIKAELRHAFARAARGMGVKVIGGSNAPFELLPGNSPREDVKSPFPYEWRSRSGSRGILRVGLLDPEGIEFLVRALDRGELAEILDEVHAYKAQIVAFLPEAESKPVTINIVPVFDVRASRAPLAQVVVHGPGEIAVPLDTSAPSRIRTSLYSRLHFTTRAARFLDERLGFPLTSIIRGPPARSLPTEILDGLGYEFAPALARRGYFVPRVRTDARPIYRRAVAALIKMNELGLVYVDRSLISSRSRALKFASGLMTRDRFQKTWYTLAADAEPDPTSGRLLVFEGILIYEGVAKAIESIEKRGFLYREGLGYVTPP